VKLNVTRLAVLATIGAVLGLAPLARAQEGSSTAAPKPQRIVIVNIAKVLRDYQKANYEGSLITTKRQAYITRVNALREKLAAVNTEFNKAANPEVKKEHQKKALEFQRQIEDIDREAQTELTKQSNDTIVGVYREIKGIITQIAETNNIDMVLCYPAATKTEDENSPQVAQLMLQTPALIPFYHNRMDITDYVIKALNQKYPSPAPIQPAGAKESAPAAGGALPSAGSTPGVK
jgi:Skp family chaperone for outer membrane proteins